MIDLIKMALHLNKSHSINVSKVSVPAFDPSAKGYYYKCSCGKSWAK